MPGLHLAPSPAARVTLRCGRHELPLDRPRVMGILNVTPDSFSDGGLHVGIDAALALAAQLVKAGVDIVDVGGESTRPGATPVSSSEELDRVVPVISAIVERFDIIVSVDTSKPVVMRAAAAAGAGMINDVRALGEPGALQAVAATGLPVCLMHMQGTPADMQDEPRYDDVLEEVLGFLEARRGAAVAAGVARDQVLFDPGFGFGKRLDHNLALVAGIPRLARSAPVLAGVSRKRMIAELLGDATLDRTMGSVAAALALIARGVSIVRVHDAKETVQALAVWSGMDRGSLERGG